MSPTITGFDSAMSIPEGAILSRTFWTIPDNYTIGQTCASQAQALEFALIEAHRKGLTTVTIDLRWKFMFPAGRGGMETTVQRWYYDNLASAQEHLDRIRFYAEAAA